MSKYPFHGHDCRPRQFAMFTRGAPRGLFPGVLRLMSLRGLFPGRCAARAAAPPESTSGRKLEGWPEALPGARTARGDTPHVRSPLGRLLRVFSPRAAGPRARAARALSHIEFGRAVCFANIASSSAAQYASRAVFSPRAAGPRSAPQVRGRLRPAHSRTPHSRRAGHVFKPERVRPRIMLLEQYASRAGVFSPRGATFPGGTPRPLGRGVFSPRGRASERRRPAASRTAQPLERTSVRKR